MSVRIAIGMGCCMGQAGGIGSALASIGAIAGFGVSEVHWVTPFSSNAHTWDGICNTIKSNGMTPVLNPFNDSAGNEAGSLGGDISGWVSELRNIGWRGVAGEGVNGDYVAQVQQHLPYVNYGGYYGPTQVNVYTDPYYHHPTTGNFGHSDYYETYGEGNNVGANGTTVSCCIDAGKNRGSSNVGILIGAWLTADVYTWKQMVHDIEAGGVTVKTILLWRGYDGYDPWPTFNNGVVGGLKNDYGLTVSDLWDAMGGGTPVTPVDPTPVDPTPVDPTPDTEIIDIGWETANVNVATMQAGLQVILAGHAYYATSGDVAPVGEGLSLICANSSIYPEGTPAQAVDISTWTAVGDILVGGAGDFRVSQTNLDGGVLYYMVVNKSTDSFRSDIIKATWTGGTGDADGSGTSFNPLPVSPEPPTVSPGISVMLRDTARHI